MSPSETRNRLHRCSHASTCRSSKASKPGTCDSSSVAAPAGSEIAVSCDVKSVTVFSTVTMSPGGKVDDRLLRDPVIALAQGAGWLERA